ncbi:restriction endonuclease subunit S [Hydrogeniiclostridium mannosilyticum]|uniref:restriction endonuclease subunit S n=1 Tax=Hydrogeniiclostridium mannosilyticum TaxID=2764322 RepID=UPI0018AAA6D9|nr:restriction endonuclease subunit S [Hydrogeniiclostridium mannosilyticum]
MARLGDVCEILDSKRVPITATERQPGPYPYYGANGVQDFVADYIFDDELVLLAEDGGNFGSKDKPIAYRVSGKCWVNNHAHVLKPKKELDVDYLCYSLMFYDVTGLVNGATRQKLTQADMRKMEIPLPPLDEQRKIAAVLDKVSGLISKRRQQLDKLDELVKSRFIEIYGVIENNPFGLPTKSMVEICQIIDGDRGTNYPKQEDFSENGYCLFLNAKNVTSKGFSFDTCMYITQEKDNQLRKGKLARGDVVLTTRGTIGNLAFYDDFVPYDHVRINSGMVILRMDRTQMLEKFFIEQFKMQLSSIKEKIASGSAQPQLPISTMNKIKLLLPPIELQQQFVVSIEQTDKSKLAIQKSLQKLETLKKALMQKYFG